MYEHEVKFSLFGKNFKSTFIGDTKEDILKELTDFVISKLTVISIEKKDSEWNDLAKEADDILDELKK